MTTDLFEGRHIISRFLSDDGSQTGVKEMARTADEYYIICPPGSGAFVIATMIVQYQDAAGGTTNEYGNIGAPLTNGISLKMIEADGVTVHTDLTDGLPVKRNGEWARFTESYAFYEFGAGPNVFTAKWIFTDCGSSVWLEPGQRLSMFVDDDLSLLTTHRAYVQGFIR